MGTEEIGYEEVYAGKKKKGETSPLRPTEDNKSKEQNKIEITDMQNKVKGSISGAQGSNGGGGSINLFLWMMFSVVLPLLFIVIVPLLFCIYPRTRQAYKTLLGDGVFLVFSGLLLLSVQGLLQQTRLTIIYNDLNIGLLYRAVGLLVLGVTILVIYSFNIIFITLDEFKVLPRKDFGGAESTWIFLGVVATLVALIFSLYAIYYNNKSLLLRYWRMDL